MKLKTLPNANINGKTILYRAPYDIAAVEKGGVWEVADDIRIRATLPTLQYLLKENCKIVILTYVKRPDGQVVEKLRTTPHARRLAELLDHPVAKADDCVGREVEERVAALKPGEILMLENARFHKEENEDNDEFAQELCKGKDMIVFDGFPQAMRIHASTTGILRHLPAVAGFYLEKEISLLSRILENPKRPFAAIIGGAKISDKVDAVNNLLKIADKVLVGGAVANVFLKAKGAELGDSFVEDVFVDEKRRDRQDWVEYAKKIFENYGDKVVCPVDLIISDGQAVKTIAVPKETVPLGWAALDLGPQTIANFEEIIKTSPTVFLGGPMGKFEDDKFGGATEKILKAIAQNKGTTVIAGGDTIEAAQKFSNLDIYTGVSLAGGATMDFLAGKKLPALLPLMED